MLKWFSSLNRLILGRKVPVKLQMNQYDCGPSCLHMVLAYYGFEADFSKLKDRFTSVGNGRDGISMLKLKEVAQSYHMKAIAKKTTYDNLCNDFVPAILYWENKHFVVLERIKPGNLYVIVDPALGRLELNEKDFSEKYSNVFLSIYPDKDFQARSEQNYSKVTYFRELILNNKKYFLLAILLAFGLQIVSVTFPFLMQISVDSAIQEGGYSLFPVLITGIIFLTLFQLCFSYFKDICIVRLQERLDHQLTNNFISSMLFLPYQYFEVRSRGDLILRINSNVTIRELMSQKFISTIINIFLIVVTFSVIFIQSKIIALSLLALGSLQFLVFFYTKGKFKKLTQAQIAAQSLAGSFMTEVLEGISTIKSLGVEEFTEKRWGELFTHQLKAIKEKGYYQTKVNTASSGINFLTPMLILTVGLFQMAQGNMTVGMIVSFQSLAVLFLSPLNSLAMMLNEFVTVDALLERIYDVLNAEKEFEKKSSVNGDKIQSLELKGHIKINHVDFQYNNYGNSVLKDINLTIMAGQRIALVGRSGSGKSTLANLLVGLYTPTKGTIYFDNVNMDKIERKSLRSQTGIVLQDNFVFNRTIFENITLHAPESTMEDVLWAAHLADIHSDIENMPMKYNTLISESGTNLSGGQKQRIALARALVNRPKILLLDEATSSLDTVTEALISENLKKINCTQIVIAHRLSTIINSDKIYVLNQGQIVDVGTHSELIKRSQHYRDMVSAQMTDHTIQYK